MKRIFLAVLLFSGVGLWSAPALALLDFVSCSATAGSVSFGDYSLSLATRELSKGDQVHMLTTGEFAVLKALVEHAREPLTRDKLMNLARGREWDALERSIDVQVSRLRRMIEPDPSKPRYIQTVWGVGYVFVPDGNK